MYVLPVYLNLSYGSPETGSCPNSQNIRITYPLDKRVVLDVLSLLPIMDHLSGKSESLTVQKTKKKIILDGVTLLYGKTSIGNTNS